MARRWIDRWRGFRADCRGAVAVEFAVSGLVFVALMLFVVALGFRLYVQVALDYASSRAARLLAVDSTQSRSVNPASFQALTFCPLLSRMLPCQNIAISLQAVTDYRTGSTVSTAATTFNPGQGGSLMLLQVTYTLPVLSWPSPVAGAGSQTFAHASVSVGYPYQNEY